MNEPVAVIAAHPDDEVLGCGGTMARHAREGRSVHVLLLADGETSRAQADDANQGSERVEARKAAAFAACEILGCASVQVLALPDNRLDGLDLLDIVWRIESFIALHAPSTVLTHHAGDVNVDHRMVHDAVVAACRPMPEHPVRELLFFETASSTEWRPPGSAPVFAPNWFVDISDTLAAKLDALRAYQSEMRPFPHARSIEAVQALAAWRGATVGVVAAEAFMLGRTLIRQV
jgi:LmbE family N-acetylglucosaminyl deacetylase